MANIKYFTQEIALEPFHIEGPLRFAGYNRRQAVDLTDKILNELKEKDTITFSDLGKCTAEKIGDDGVRNNYLTLNQFLSASYERKFDKPFFILIGGTTTTGKDLLATDLQYNLEIDRIVTTDYLREIARTEALNKYEDKEKVPEKLKPLFGATYKVGKDGFDLQVKHVAEKIPDLFVEQAIREYQRWMHPFFILQGIHAVPGTDDCIKGDNKHLVIINPSEQALRERVFVRQEKEIGAMSDKNKDERVKDWHKLYDMQKYILEVASQKGGTVISSDSREDVLHQFADSLTPKLEKILRKI